MWRSCCSVVRGSRPVAVPSSSCILCRAVDGAASEAVLVNTMLAALSMWRHAGLALRSLFVFLSAALSRSFCTMHVREESIAFDVSFQ